MLLAPFVSVALVDRTFLCHGSTGHAPGFVGQLNSIPTLTKLATMSIAFYRTVPGGFAAVGGLEVLQGRNWPAYSSTEDTAAALREREAAARKQGVDAEVLLPKEIAQLAPHLVRPDNGGGLRFPNDGTANAKRIATFAKQQAEAEGAVLISADVVSVSGEGDSWTLETSGDRIRAKRVVLATGIWGPQLLPSIASQTVAVAHPYAYSAPHGERDPSPFVRYPAAHVYARDHGHRDGIGSYSHDPVHVRSQAVAQMPTAYGEWDPSFDSVMKKALQIVPPETAQTFDPLLVPSPKDVDVADGGAEPYAFNGLFTVTPDALPLFGRHSSGIWTAVGAWVTHAAGCAQVLAAEIRHSLGQQDAERQPELATALDPKRFEGEDEAKLEKKALATYNDIYNKEEAKE